MSFDRRHFAPRSVAINTNRQSVSHSAFESHYFIVYEIFIKLKIKCIHKHCLTRKKRFKVDPHAMI